MSGATQVLEGFEAIQIEVGQREFEVTYEAGSLDPAAIKAAGDESGNPCELAP